MYLRFRSHTILECKVILHVEALCVGEGPIEDSNRSHLHLYKVLLHKIHSNHSQALSRCVILDLKFVLDAETISVVAHDSITSVV